MYRFAFVMDQQVGLRTQAINLEQVVATDASIHPTWVPVRYQTPAGLLTRLPGIPGDLKGTLRGVGEIRDGLGDARRFEAILWATWAAKSVPDLVVTSPSFLVMDMTPVQMEAMGSHYGYSRARSRFLGNWKRRATQRLYRQATHLFPWNEWVAASLRDDYGVLASKITPISPGVDVELYRPDPQAKQSDGVVRLLFVGGDFKRKGGDLLLKWAQQTRITTPWQLHIVTRDEVPETRHVCIHRNLPNNSPELVRLYQQSDLFVLPTRADCYSLVALEAMAAGLPVIISGLGGIPQIVEHERTGYLIDPNDDELLAARLNDLITHANLRQNLGEAARRRACLHFNCHVNMQGILDAMKRETVGELSMTTAVRSYATVVSEERKR